MTSFSVGAADRLKLLCPTTPKTRKERAGNLYRFPPFPFSKGGKKAGQDRWVLGNGP
jgi:hypothetical protein